MRAEPDMKPWVNTYKTKKSSDEERHFFGVSICRWECRPYGAQDMLIDYKPRACALGYAGVSPLQGSSTSSPSINFSINQLFGHFDAVALLFPLNCNADMRAKLPIWSIIITF